MITGNVIGGTLRNPETLILYDESTGIEYTASMVDSEDVELTATVNDVREGKVVALESGVETGTKEIPSYNTTEGIEYVLPGNMMNIVMRTDRCQFTKFQALVCDFNTNFVDSVSTKIVSINGKVYEVNSIDSLSDVFVDNDTKTISLEVMNTSQNAVIIRYFTYKEEY